MELGSEFRARVEEWDLLFRWERSELGKDLRRLGLSYGEIRDLIPVEKSTLATWCREVRLTEAQMQAIRERPGSREGIPRDTNRKRRAEISLVRIDALSQTPYLMTDPLWVAGGVLYWAKGAKTRNHLKMVNADPPCLRLFVHRIRDLLDPHADFSLQLHLHEGNDEGEPRSIGLPRPVCRLPTSTRHSSNRNALAIARTTTPAWQRTMTWVELVAEHMGFPNLGSNLLLRAASSIG